MAERSESGFTLIEVLVATVVLGLIIGPMTAAIILGFKTEGTVAERLTTSQGRFLLNVYVPRDAMQASKAYASSAGPTIPFASVCAGQSVSGQVPTTATFINPVSVPLVLTWTAQTVSTDSQGHVTLSPQSFEVDYVLAPEPGHPDGLPQSTGDWLWRFAFTTTTSYSTGQPSTGCQFVTGSNTQITRDINPVVGATGTVTNIGSGLLQSVSLGYTDLAGCVVPITSSCGNSYIASGGARA
jgi:prepilin-type N-terminal cleavage/methylation domain-containing protein